MRALVLVLAVGWLFAAGVARAQPAADAVALLPLDADQRLEIYGQPVAAELARALVAEKIDVVVVGAKMAVPQRARFVVDGTIKALAGEHVVLTARIRDRATGTVVAKATSEAEALTSIDHAAEQLGKQVLALVQAQLAKKPEPQAHPEPAVTAPAKPPAAAEPRKIVVSVGNGPLQELAAAADAWAGNHHRTVAKPASGLGEDAAITLEPLAYDVRPGEVPTARARVHVKIQDRAHKVVFDRVVVTDTVVGDRKLPLPQLAARTAREVLAIVEPHMRRVVEGWK